MAKTQPEPIRDPVTDHLLTPENCALVLIDYQPEQYRTVTIANEARYLIIHSGVIDNNEIEVLAVRIDTHIERLAVEGIAHVSPEHDAAIACYRKMFAARIINSRNRFQEYTV